MDEEMDGCKWIAAVHLTVAEGPKVEEKCKLKVNSILTSVLAVYVKLKSLLANLQFKLN